jgi:hypothetical protein
VKNENGQTIIYLVWEGDYSDARVIAAFSEKENADLCVAANPPAGRYIQDIALDDNEMNHWLPEWTVRMERNGDLISAMQYRAYGSQDYWSHLGTDLVYGVYNCYCNARDEAHAIKIAGDRRAQSIAMGLDRRQATT